MSNDPRKRIGGTNTTLGWQPTCDCDAGEPVPCIAIDPFSGSGTVGKVCAALGRDYIGIDLSAEYNDMALERIDGTQIELPLAAAGGIE